MEEKPPQLGPILSCPWRHLVSPNKRGYSCGAETAGSGSLYREVHRTMDDPGSLPLNMAAHSYPSRRLQIISLEKK